MHSNRLDHTKQALQAELLDVFMDYQTHEDRDRDSTARKRKLQARRAIEQFKERKALEEAIRNGWDDL